MPLVFYEKDINVLISSENHIIVSFNDEFKKYKLLQLLLNSKYKSIYNNLLKNYNLSYTNPSNHIKEIRHTLIEVYNKLIKLILYDNILENE